MRGLAVAEYPHVQNGKHDVIYIVVVCLLRGMGLFSQSAAVVVRDVGDGIMDGRVCCICSLFYQRNRFYHASAEGRENVWSYQLTD